ncbi:MAG: alpha/beta fold hydrolase [Solirubrobacteraceae bacterium]
MPEVEGAGVALHYAERGDGRPLLIVHGMASDAAVWSPALDELAAAGARVIAYDRRGYGASGAPRPYAATTVQEQAEDAAALLSALGAAPAVLVGEGFGALVVLELLVRRPQLATAAVLADPPLLAFVPAATEALAAERSLLERALRDGDPREAIDAWLGPCADADRRERARSSQIGFFADYAGQASWSPARRELRAIGLPVAVVTGHDSPPHIVAAADAAAALLPDARRRGDGDVVAAACALLA